MIDARRHIPVSHIRYEIIQIRFGVLVDVRRDDADRLDALSTRRRHLACELIELFRILSNLFILVVDEVNVGARREIQLKSTHVRETFAGARYRCTYRVHVGIVLGERELGQIG